MHLHTSHHAAPQGQAPGWSVPLDASLDGESTLVLAFGSPGLAKDPAPLQDLARSYPRSVLLGCSTAGEIAGSQVHDASLSVAVARFDHTRLRTAQTQVADPAHSNQAGAALARSLLGEGLKAVFVLSDGLGVNGSMLVEGMRSALPADVSISGGLAGDGTAFKSTWVFDGRSPAVGRVCAVGFYGDRIQVGHGCDHGWSEFGPQRRVTRSQGNVLYELDGKPALELYKSYLGELASGLPGTALLFPLAVWQHDGSTDHLVRTILGIDEKTQSMTFAGDIPEGWLARLMRSNNEALIDSAGRAADAASQTAAGGPALVVSVSCVGRRLVLGERTDEELETVQSGAPADAAHIGFYSYGEISPALNGGISELRNQTMTVTVISES